MKVRNDSPFAKLTEDQCDKLLCFSKTMTIEDLCKAVEGMPEPIRCSLSAMRKFIKRLEKEQCLESMEEDQDLVERMSKRASSPAVREATLETMRQRMFEVVFETSSRDALMETFQALNAEKDKERAAALEERKVKVMEENAKIGWRKLECENARAGLKALPRVRELLSDETRPIEDRVSAALRLLAQIEVNPLLWMESALASEARVLPAETELRELPAPTTAR